MTTLHQSPEGVVAYIKGAPERVLAQCNKAAGNDGPVTFELEAVLAEAAQLANEGYRVLALAKREFTALPEPLEPETTEQDLTFLGLVALIDPPRPEVSQAVTDCLTAGITPVMITGDHPGTAMAIARRLGIANDDQIMLSGDELAKLSGFLEIRQSWPHDAEQHLSGLCGDCRKTHYFLNGGLCLFAFRVSGQELPVLPGSDYADAADSGQNCSAI